MHFLPLMYADSQLWIAGLIAGVLLCFFGNRLFFKSLFLFGFLALAIPGYGIGKLFYGFLGGVIGLILGGITGGVLFISLYQVGFFLLGFLAGAALGFSFTGHLLAPAVLGIIGGIVFVIFTEAFIIFGTTLVGTYMVSENLFFLIPSHWSLPPGIFFAFRIFIFILGFLFQMTARQEE